MGVSKRTSGEQLHYGMGRLSAFTLTCSRLADGENKEAAKTGPPCCPRVWSDTLGRVSHPGQQGPLRRHGLGQPLRPGGHTGEGWPVQPTGPGLKETNADPLWPLWLGGANVANIGISNRSLKPACLWEIFWIITWRTRSENCQHSTAQGPR